jgi:hypothetical protein
VNDIASKFALLYAGGVLWVRLEILHWTEDDIRSALMTCFRNARWMLINYS